MTALAGVLTVMLLASCQKEVEIDGDVEEEPASYSYRYVVSGTARHKYQQYKNEEWISQDDWEEDRIANMATIEWNDDKNTSQTVYYVSVFYSSDGLEETDGASFSGMLTKCGDKYYFRSWDDSKKDYYISEVTVNGSIGDGKFTMSAKDLLGWINWPHENGTYQRGLYTFDSLTFSC